MDLVNFVRINFLLRNDNSRKPNLYFFVKRDISNLINRRLTGSDEAGKDCQKANHDIRTLSRFA
ncbi:MAG: hypothetical protein ACK4NV_05900 [Pannonibacter sp.]